MEGSLALPSEIWHRVLLEGGTFDHDELNALCFVCRLFADICQPSLFDKLAISVCAGLLYSNCDLDSPASPWRTNAGAKRWPNQEWEWERWEADMRRAVSSERRLTLIGSHGKLSLHPREMAITGYRHDHHAYPSNPFQAPSKKQMLSRAMFNAFHDFRQTLLKRLPVFANLRGLNLFRYPVDNELVTAINSHPTLTEIQFDFCWFPKSPIPLTSVTSLSFGSIPGSHIHPTDAEATYDNVPDHHVASAFALINPSRIEELSVSFGAGPSETEPILRQLCASISDLGTLPCLRSLKWRFCADRGVLISLPSSLVLQVLARTPALRILDCLGYLPFPPPVPLASMPHLKTISCPLEWGRAVVPGRPLADIRLYLGDPLRHGTFLAQTESELEDLLGPITLSAAPVTTLRLLTHPPVAPVSLLFRYISTRFSGLRSLEVTVAEDHVAAPPAQWGGSWMVIGQSPYTDTAEQVVEEGLIELLQQDLRDDVERVLNCNQAGRDKALLPPVLDRIMAFRGISESQLDEPHPPAIEREIFSRSSTPDPPAATFRSDEVDFEPFYSSQSSGASPPEVAEEGAPEVVLEKYIELLRRHFGDSNDIPTSKPRTSLDLVYFFSRGYSALPPALRSLTLCSCFGKIPFARYSPEEISPEDFYPASRAHEDYELCTRATLLQITERYTELSAVKFSDCSNSGLLTSYYKEGRAWRRDITYNREGPDSGQWLL